MTSEKNIDMSNLNDALPVFRFKFTPNTINELNNFAKIHRYDERDDFKEAWEEWIDINDDIINEETTRLNRLGYKGDIVDKMYKSVRYYYRKKPLSKQEPSKRRQYYSLGKEILNAMDEHIHKNYKQTEFTPASGFNEFCNEYLELLRKEIMNMTNLSELDSNSITTKIKKTYKNRYFRVSRNMTIVTSESE